MTTTEGQSPENDALVACIAAVLADHWPAPVFGCECTPTDEDEGTKAILDEPWERHAASLVARAIPLEGTAR